MAGIDWLYNLFIPIIKVVFIGGISGFIVYIVTKAFHNAYSKQTKFFFKYKIFRRKYPEKTMKWCLDAIDNGIGYYDAKKFLMVKMIPQKQINETLYVYDQVLNEMSYKGGKDNNGRKYKASDRKVKIPTTELPKI